MEQPFGPQLVAGDAWSFTVTPPDGYGPADGYTSKLFFRGLKVLDIEATNDGTSFLFAATSVATKVLTAGSYTWSLNVYDVASARTELGRGMVEILENIETQVEGFDGRSFVKKTLDAIRANLTGLCGREDQQYQINGRMLQTMRRKELLELEGEFAARYRREQVTSGQIEDNGMVRVRFTA